MILHIPHSSVILPHNFELAEGNDLDTELLRMTDWYTDELFFHDNADMVVFNHSRLYCDVERFRDDVYEPMFALGMGVCYTMNSFGGKLRDISESEAEYIKSEFYDRHHKEFTDAVSRQLSLFESVVIVDCHSFSDLQLPHESSAERPDFCLGVDDFHTPLTMVLKVKSLLEEKGFTVMINTPFSGTIVPLRYYHNQDKVQSIMIEVNRGLYLDGKEKNSRFAEIKSLLTEVLSVINEFEVI